MKTFTVNGEILEFIKSDYEAEASISLNPNFKWCRVVVTDDKPNANNHRIPNTEFSNLIKSGINAPIKMARGEISGGHAEAWGNPIGALAKLKEEDDMLHSDNPLSLHRRINDLRKTLERTHHAISNFVDKRGLGDEWIEEFNNFESSDSRVIKKGEIVEVRE